MIRAEQLVKDFVGPLRAVDGLSFEVEPGEIYGLLGPNGAAALAYVAAIFALLDVATVVWANYFFDREHLLSRR